MQYGKRFSAKPNRIVQETLWQWIGAQEYIYNAKVGEDRYYRTFARKYLPIGTFPEVNQQYSHIKTEQNEWLKTVPSQILRNGATSWAQAYQRFFQKLGGRPKIKKKTGKRSVWLTNEVFRFVEVVSKDGVISHEIEIGTQNKPVGRIPFVAHLQYTIPKTIHISNANGKWFVSFNNDDAGIEPTQEEIIAHLKSFESEELEQKTIAVDRGCHIPMALSTGENKDFSAIQKQRIAKNEAQKIKWQKRQARRKKGSNRYRQACARVSRYCRYGNNVRKDFAHKTSFNLVKSDAVLFGFEDLQIKNMTRSAKGNKEKHGKNVAQKAGLNKSILGSAWGMTTSFTEYKARRAGKLVVKVKPNHSSQECSRCGHTHKDNRKTQSLFVCQACNFTANADYNASLVLKKRAIALLLSESFTGKKQKKSVNTRKKVGQVVSELSVETPTISQEMTSGETVSDAIGTNVLVAQWSMNRETPTITRRV